MRHVGRKNKNNVVGIILCGSHRILYGSIDAWGKRKNNLKVTRCGKAKLAVGSVYT